MKTMMKKNLIKACAILAVAAIPVAFASINTVETSANTVTSTASKFYMEKGASVRTTSDEVGIRFKATITKSYWEELQKEYGADATYSFYSVVTDDTKDIKKDYGTITPDFTESDTHNFYSTIVYTTEELEEAGLLDEACELELSAQTYLEVTKAGETEATTIVAYGTTGKRSMKAVANAAVLDGNEEEDLAKYFTVGNRSEAIECYSFEDNSGVVNMAAMPAWTNDMEVYYGAEKVNVTYANGTLSLTGFALPEGQTQGYMSVFNGSTVYSAKVSDALKITQAQVEDGTLFTNIQTNDANMVIYLASNISLAGKTWTPTDVFAGTFDGGNHIIDGLTTTTNSESAYYGFFRRLNGTLKNVAFTNVTLAANSAVICGDTRANTIIENVFIHVRTTATAGTSDYSAICNRAPSSGGARMILVSDVVIKMPGTAPNESVYGYQHYNVVQSIWTNVYTIGIKDTTSETLITFPFTSASLGSVPETNNCGFYANLAEFHDNATKKLTPFLESCVNTYTPAPDDGTINITADTVHLLKSIPTDAHVVLMEDIDLNGATWSEQGHFAGTLDGNGHVIKNFTIPSKDSWGFFITAVGTIKNIGFVDVKLEKGASVIAARNGSGTLTLENVFIDVVEIADTSATNGILSRVRKNEKSVVTMTNVVASIPSSKAKVFGALAQYQTKLTNVYTIGMPTSAPYADDAQVAPTIKGGGHYADLAEFNGATKTLTDFLSSCVANYLN